MAVDTDYLDDLMKSIEPAIYPDGVPGEEPEEEAEQVFGEEEEFADAYEMELASIPEKNSIVSVEQEVASAIEAIDGVSADLDNGANDVVDDVPDGVEQWDEIKVSSVPEAEEIELDMSMSEEEIDAMLNAARESAKDESVSVSEADDVTDLLAMFDGDSDMRDIKETLEKSDNNIAVDQSALEEAEIVIPDLDGEDEGESEPKKGKRQKKEKKKDKKKAKTADDNGEAKEKKPGFFSRLLGALTEEDPEDAIVPEQLETGVTDENAQILSELDAEDKGKKKKKKKKDKKGKASKEQAETQGDERDIREKSDDEDEDGGNKGKKKKPKKEKKPKEKKEEVPEKTAKKLPKKRVRNTFILCLSILAAVILLSFFATDTISKKNARYAFDNQEYDVAYEELYGMKLNEADNAIYQKSKLIMLLERKLESHDNYMQLGMKTEALNALLEGVDLYPSVIEKAQELGVGSNVQESYNRILAKLADFGVTAQEAEEINNYTSSVKYNKRLLSIVNNIPFEYSGDSEVHDTVIIEDNPSVDLMEDILPEEEDFLPDNPEEVFDDSDN